MSKLEKQRSLPRRQIFAPAKEGGEANPPRTELHETQPRQESSSGGADNRNDGVFVRLPSDMLDWVDARRGGKTRPQFIRECLEHMRKP